MEFGKDFFIDHFHHVIDLFPVFLNLPMILLIHGVQ